MGRQTIVTIKPTKQANGIYNSEGNLDWGGTIATFFPCLDENKIAEEYEGPKFIATLEALARSVSAVAIVVPDSALRHTLARKPQHANKSEAERKQIGVDLGTAWLERNEAEIKDILGDKLKGIWRWDEFIETDEVSGISMSKVGLPSFMNDREKNDFFVQKRNQLERLLDPKTRIVALQEGCSIPGISAEHLADYLEALEFSTGPAWRAVRTNRTDKFDSTGPLAQIIRRHNHEEAIQYLLWAEELKRYKKGCPDGSIIVYPHALTKAMNYLIEKLVQTEDGNALRKVNLAYTTRMISDKKDKKRDAEENRPPQAKKVAACVDEPSLNSSAYLQPLGCFNSSMPLSITLCNKPTTPERSTDISAASSTDISLEGTPSPPSSVGSLRNTPPKLSVLLEEKLALAQDMTMNSVDYTLNRGLSPKEKAQYLCSLAQRIEEKLLQVQAEVDERALEFSTIMVTRGVKGI